jgi:hypothetical protein
MGSYILRGDYGGVLGREFYRVEESEMKTAELGDYFLWKGQLVKVGWINRGSKSIGFKFKREIHCPECGHLHLVDDSADVIEDSPLFQENAQPITSIKIT